MNGSFLFVIVISTRIAINACKLNLNPKKKYPQPYTEKPRNRALTKKAEDSANPILLSVDEAAEYTGFKRNTLYQKRIFMDHLQLSGWNGKIYFPLDSLEKFVRSNVVYGKVKKNYNNKDSHEKNGKN